MKLHRNAALSWRGRRELARRVVVDGWTLAAAAAAALSAVLLRRGTSAVNAEHGERLEEEPAALADAA
jgi:hypothetical protein